MTFFLSQYNLLPNLYGLIIVIPLAILYSRYLRKKTTKKYSGNYLSEESIKEDFNPNKFTEIINDKVVRIENIEFPELKKVVQQFCNIYNEENNQAIIRLSNIKDNEFILTFPFDTTDEIFYYLVNYLNFPEGATEYNPKITGWLTANDTNLKSNKEPRNKKIMVFVPEETSEYDNVYCITNENITYKISFKIGSKVERVNNIKSGLEGIVYHPISNIRNLSELSFIDMK